MAPVGSYSQDVLTRIIKVHWSGGGVFVAANSDGNIFYLKLGGATDNDEKPRWQDLGPLDFVQNEGMFTGLPRGGSYGSVDVKDAAGNVIGKTPVFVLVGGGSGTDSIGIIMASPDGKNWSRVFSFGAASDSYVGAVIWAVVWDEDAQMFFAGGHQSDNFGDPESEHRWMAETDLLFSSPDGFTWTEAGRHQMRVDSFHGEPFPPWPEYPTGLLDSHCSKRLVDSQGNGIPDGFYGYDKTKEMMIAPAKPLIVDYFLGSVGFSPGGLTVTMDGQEPYPSDPGIPASCVATAGGKWVAAGGVYDPAGGGQPPQGGGKSQAAILTTDDDGNPAWQRLDPPGTNMIIAVCGGPLSDVEV